jgi:hypothetical protein
MTNNHRGAAAGESQQLLLHYCFGHSESSLLLCPITLLGQRRREIVGYNCPDSSDSSVHAHSNAVFNKITFFDTPFWHTIAPEKFEMQSLLALNREWIERVKTLSIMKVND